MGNEKKEYETALKELGKITFTRFYEVKDIKHYLPRYGYPVDTQKYYDIIKNYLGKRSKKK